jgi:hypothetical protein
VAALATTDRTGRLRELIVALDRRVPRAPSPREAAVARDAAVLRERAVRRLTEIADEHDTREQRAGHVSAGAP